MSIIISILMMLAFVLCLLNANGAIDLFDLKDYDTNPLKKRDK